MKDQPHLVRVQIDLRRKGALSREEELLAGLLFLLLFFFFLV
jgi:hypothetical protein